MDSLIPQNSGVVPPKTPPKSNNLTVQLEAPVTQTLVQTPKKGSSALLWIALIIAFILMR